MGIYVKYPSFLSDFNETWVFLTDFWKVLILTFMQIYVVGAKLLHADAQTDGQAWWS